MPSAEGAAAPLVAERPRAARRPESTEPAPTWLPVTLTVAVFVLMVFEAHVSGVLGLEALVAAEIVLYSVAFVVVLQRVLSMATTRLESLFLVLVGASLVVSALRVGPLQAVLGAAFLFKPLAAFVAGTLVASTEASSRVATRLLVVTAVATALVSLGEPLGLADSYHAFMGFEASRVGALGLFPNSNQNAHAMVLGLCLLPLCSRHRSTRLGLALILVAGVFLSASRQGLLGLLVVAGVKVWRDRRSPMRAVTLWGILLSAATIAAWPLLGPRISDVGRALQTGDYFRFRAVLAGVRVLADNVPFGGGLGSFGGAVASFLHSPLHESYGVFDHWIGYENRPTTIDMYWVHAWVELGTPLLLLYVYALLRVRRAAWWAAPALHSVGGDTREALDAAFWAVVAWGWFSMALEAPSTSLFFLFFLGAIVSQARRRPGVEVDPQSRVQGTRVHPRRERRASLGS